MISVLILNDYSQEPEAVSAIKTALVNRFATAGHPLNVEVDELRELISLHRTTPNAVAKLVLSMGHVPEVVLVDCYMPDADDGLRVIDALRRSGYRGYTYLWSAGSPRGDLDRQPAMFIPPGSGGFRTIEYEALASAIWESWKELGGFEVQRPEERILHDPLSPALQMLTELQAGLFAAEDSRLTQAQWKTVCQRARDHFDAGNASFCSAIQPFRQRGIDTASSYDLLERLPGMPLSDLPAIMECVRELRDRLLNLVELCR